METPNLATAYFLKRSHGYAAARALELARENYAAFKAARLDYESKAAFFDHAAKEGADDSAYAAAREQKETALRNLTCARIAVSFYGRLWSRPYVGTWQPSDPGHFYIESPETYLRNVRDVHSLSRYEGGPDHNGWITDPYGDTSRDGSGLVWGVIAQLSGRGRKCRFVAGYQFGGTDNGPTFDFSRIYESDGEDSKSAIEEAARAADSMAEHKAEQEREYQTAWAAGNVWREKGDEMSDLRKEALSVLSERRELKKDPSFSPDRYAALCGLVKSRVESILETLSDLKAERDRLRDGDFPDLYFWPGDSRLQAAFCDAAGLQDFPR